MRDDVASAQACADALPNFDQHAIAGLVADDLEIVEVEKKHRDALPGAVGMVECTCKSISEQRAVGQAGELVVQCLELERVFGWFATGHVAVDAQDGVRFAVPIDLQRPTTVDHHGAAVTPSVDELAFPAPCAHQLRVDRGQRP
jgi:hypothetical protein